MNTSYIIVAVVLVVVILVAILWPMMARRKRSERLQGQFGSEYDHTVQALGNEQKAQVELNKRQKHVEAMDIRPLTVTKHKLGHSSEKNGELILLKEVVLRLIKTSCIMLNEVMQASQMLTKNGIR